MAKRKRKASKRRVTVKSHMRKVPGRRKRVRVKKHTRKRGRR